MITKANRMQALQSQILDENICPDLAAQATQLVMGEGNLDAHIVFIGEAPGKQEDIQGLPFVGASGRFLNEMLQAAGLVRSDIYITNIVKYRPPNNRDPLPAEKKSFLPFMIRQIEIIQPKVIITLGRHSMEYFLPGTKISELHGQPQQIQVGEQRLMLVPLYHPAAALYNGSMRQTLIDDFMRAAAIARGAK